LSSSSALQSLPTHGRGAGAAVDEGVRVAVREGVREGVRECD
jgi:hypothetical protein